MPSDPLNPLGPAPSPGLTPSSPGFQLPPGLTGETPATETPAKEGTPAPAKSPAESIYKAPDSPLPSLEGKAPEATKAEPAKTEPAKTEPAKTEPAKK
jgi:hypothetical protein